jgi:hypothetical protein
VKKRADKLTATTGKTVLPSITAQTKAQEEANRLNITNQSVINATESVVEAITKLVGSNVTDAILRTAKGSNHKSINEFTLYEVMKVAINGADLPSTTNVLEQLIEVINHTFDFCKKVSINMELMQSNVAQMAMYGIVIGTPQLTPTLLANIKTTTKSDYGHKFCSSMHTIFKKYTYNHVHDADSLQIIIKELAGADGMRVLKDTPAPSAGIAHLVAESVSYLQVMMNGDTNSAYTKSAHGVSSDSNSSKEECKPWGCNCKKSYCSKPCSKCRKQKKDKDNEPKKNTCPYCKKNPLQEAPFSQTKEAHVEQEIQGLAYRF